MTRQSCLIDSRDQKRAERLPAIHGGYTHCLHETMFPLKINKQTHTHNKNFYFLYACSLVLQKVLRKAACHIIFIFTHTLIQRKSQSGCLIYTHVYVNVHVVINLITHRLK